jgi:predicted  nucleic acid-binding Zn-ribbon protein
MKGGLFVGQLDILWEYQIFDMKMDKYNQMRKNIPLRYRLIELRDYLMKQQEQLIKYNDEADKKNNTLNRINHEYEIIANTFKADYNKIENTQVKTLKQLDEIHKTALELKEKLAKKEEELEALINDVQSLSTKLNEIRRNILKAKKEYSGIKSQYDQEVKKIQKEYQTLKAKRDDLRSKLSDSLIAKYNNLKNSRNTAVVKIENNCCGGCNMALAALVLEKLKQEGSIVECENCGRILYSGSSD